MEHDRPHAPARARRRARALWWLAGLAATTWVALRVVPRPSRAAYPCQRAAMPLSAWFLGMIAAVPAAGPGRRRPRWRWFVAGAVALFVLLAVIKRVELFVIDASLTCADEPPVATGPYHPSIGVHEPMGTGVGLHPGRVVWIHDPEVASWDGVEGSPWDHLDDARASAMLDDAVRWLAGDEALDRAWDALFADVDRRRGDPGPGYRTGDRVAIKVNANADGAPRGDSSPAVIRALLAQLIDHAGVPADAISVIDPSRELSSDWLRRVTDGHTRFDGVRFGGWRVGLLHHNHGRFRAEPSPAARVHFSGPLLDLDDPSLPVSLPRTIHEAAYLIDATVLKPNSIAGASLGAKNWFGVLHREGGWNDGWSPAFLHETLGDATGTRPGYHPLVDLMGHPELGGKTALYLLDAIYCSRSVEDAPPQRWRSAPFDGHWTASLLVSQDPVAVDSVGLDLLAAEHAAAPIPWFQGSPDRYLVEAALAGAPPSGTFYDPDGDGRPLQSLGVHEHWDAQRRYGRASGGSAGIELVTAPPYRAGSTRTETAAAPASAVTVSTPSPSAQSAPSHDTAGASP